MSLLLKRSLHTTISRQRPNPFFHLQALSNSRETARAAQLSKLPRVAHSPALQLLEAEASVTPLSTSRASKSRKSGPEDASAKSTLSSLHVHNTSVPVTPTSGTALAEQDVAGLKTSLQAWHRESQQAAASLADRVQRLEKSSNLSGVAFVVMTACILFGVILPAEDKRDRRKASTAATSSDRPSALVRHPETSFNSVKEDLQSPAVKTSVTDTSQYLPPNEPELRREDVIASRDSQSTPHKSTQLVSDDNPPLTSVEKRTKAVELDEGSHIDSHRPRRVTSWFW